MNRRSFLSGMALALAGAAATTTLSGCAGTSTMRGADNTADDGSPVTSLTWWSNHPGSSKDYELELIRRWEEKRPDIRINLVDAGKNYAEVANKFNAALTGADVPDIVVLSDVWWYNFAINNQLTPVSDLVNQAGIDPSTYVTSLYEDYRIGQDYYAFPFARSTPLFYYNKQSWAQAGLPERGPQTWEEMSQWGEQLRAANSEQRPFGWYNAAHNLSWTFAGPLWTMGGAYSQGWDLRLTSPETLDAVRWFQRSTDPQSGWAYIATDLAVDFSAGRCASGMLSTGDLSGISKQAKFEYGTAALPNPLGQGGCPTGGAGLAIPRNLPEKRKIAAAQFIDFITNKENTAYWSRNVGYMPVRSTAVDDPEQQKFMEENPNFRTAVDQLAHTRPQDNVRVALPGADPRIGGSLEMVATGRKDVESVMNNLNNIMSRIYENQVQPLI
ncbi:ABC transporter substrate-binding protein [Corynebacterium lowii]|nr:ABC transporter substrate-binding protein [Corynebacterium lowii]MDP9851720.1 sn-glycerol 3-phosphate transport system substrate-binding protein [Corynebacterium lowii]